MAHRDENRRRGWVLRPAARGRCLLLGSMPALAPLSVAAHADGAVAPGDLWAHWQAEPMVIVGTLLAGWLYGRGLAVLRRAGRGRRGSSGWRVAAFAGGLAVLLLALASPLDTMAGSLFSAHMVQHVLLVAVAPPLLLLGLPLVVILSGLPRAWRAQTNRLWRRGNVGPALWHALTQPVVAWVLHAATIWLWHLPPLYQAAVRHEAVHVAEHLSFLATATFFWWGVVQPVGRRRLQPGMATLSLFAMATQGGALGALLTFSQAVWYPVYIGRTDLWDLSPLSDQRLAGLIMWVPGSAPYVLAALLLLGGWLQASGAPAARPASCGARAQPPSGSPSAASPQLAVHHVTGDCP